MRGLRADWRMAGDAYLISTTENHTLTYIFVLVSSDDCSTLHGYVRARCHLLPSQLATQILRLRVLNLGSVRSPSPTWFVACVGNNNRLPPPAWWARRRRMRSTGGVGRLTATTDLPLGRHSGQCTVARTTQAHVSAVGLPADQAGMRMWCRRSDQGQRESLISFSSVAASSVTACNW